MVASFFQEKKRVLAWFIMITYDILQRNSHLCSRADICFPLKLLSRRLHNLRLPPFLLEDQDKFIHQELALAILSVWKSTTHSQW